MIVTDGPFIETKEQIGGILLLEAKDMDEAVRLMSKHPGVRLGAHSRFAPRTTRSRLAGWPEVATAMNTRESADLSARAENSAHRHVGTVCLLATVCWNNSCK